MFYTLTFIFLSRITCCHDSEHSSLLLFKMKIEEYETKTTIIVYLNKQKIITVLRRKLSKIQIGRQKHLKQVYTGSSNPTQWCQETGSSDNPCDSWPAKRLHLLCSVLFSHVPVFFRIVKKCNLFKWMIYWQIKALSAETRHCMTKPILPGNPAQDLGISVTFSEHRDGHLGKCWKTSGYPLPSERDNDPCLKGTPTRNPI